ncbi:MAG TPA: D-aminoacyl-tRNA deacylase [Burkholderiales bacterium]|nr:D-aminoacyl-tRNA deacylase [Burkholderiales bacterium]
MIALLQRVSEANVSVDGKIIASISRGILALIGIERGDTQGEADRLAEKIMAYRIFPDDAGKMNRSLKEIGGELLVVPQFTLVADTKSGTRPSFSSGASPAEGEKLFGYFAVRTGAAAGRFGADMKVSLVNDGPVTFWLQVSPQKAADSKVSSS